MFDFIQRYPKLFPERLHDPALREQFIGYMADVFAARDRINEILLSGRGHLVAFGHWNGNITTVGSNEMPTVSFSAASSIGPTVDSCRSRRSSSVRSAVPSHTFGPTTSKSCWVYS